jgi:2-amino-4-hydroxy-6-hydroxymethyldihydropteridine diphosphokinase
LVRTGLGPEACKAACVALEIALGRDRTHPSSSTRDRPADIDLLIRIDHTGSRVELEPVAAYLAQPTAEILAMLSPCQTVPGANGRIRAVTLGGLRLGEAPATIDRDDRTGLIVVR